MEDARHLELGRWGERQAVRHLERSGCRLVMTNFSAPIGARRDGRTVTGEIDVIAYDLRKEIPELVFVEVKTRSGSDVATPEAAVDRRKRRQIARTARVYRRVLRVWDEPYRFDVISVIALGDETVEIKHFRNYFEDGIFRDRSRL